MRGTVAKWCRRQAHYTMDDRGPQGRRYRILGAAMMNSGARRIYRMIKKIHREMRGI